MKINSEEFAHGIIKCAYTDCNMTTPNTVSPSLVNAALHKINLNEAYVLIRTVCGCPKKDLTYIDGTPISYAYTSTVINRAIRRFRYQYDNIIHTKGDVNDTHYLVDMNGSCYKQLSLNYEFVSLVIGSRFNDTDIKTFKELIDFIRSIDDPIVFIRERTLRYTYRVGITRWNNNINILNDAGLLSDEEYTRLLIDNTRKL